MEDKYCGEEGRKRRNKLWEDYDKLHKCCPSCGSDFIEVTTLGVWLPPDTANRANCCGCAEWEGVVDDLVESKEDKIRKALATNPELQKLAKVLAEPVRHAIEDESWSRGLYSHVVPDSGYWTSLDQMIHYFTIMPELDRREILVHLENMKKRGIVLIQGMVEDDGLVKDENGQPKGYTAKDIRASGVFGIIHGDMGGLDNYPVIDSKTYLTKEKFEQMFQASVERDLNRCK